LTNRVNKQLLLMQGHKQQTEFKNFLMKTVIVHCKNGELQQEYANLKWE
jgi:hypothetical protein